ncbi:MAG: hypothetical protein NVSMB56_01390 [Pyrinomonadaceae bacterium]
MTVGEIYWVEMPARGGHAQAGRRPAIVAQTAETSAKIPTVLIVPLTSQLDALRSPGIVLVEVDSQNGLRRASVALVFQLTAIDKKFLAGRLGKISNSLINEIWSVFDDITGRARK